MPKLLCSLAIGAAAQLVATLCTPAFAAFPDKPVHFIVGFVPGGAPDLLARVIGLKLAQKWGQAVVVDNKPGADGSIGAEIVSRSAPDGYTLVFVNTAHAISPNEYKLNYDPIKSFAPITIPAGGQDVLLVNSDLNVKTIQDLIALANSEPGKLNFGTPGQGTLPYLEMAQLMSETHMDLVHIPYKGGAESMTALLGHEIQLMFNAITTTSQQIAAGSFRALAVVGKERSPMLPDVPTIVEATGLPGFETGAWYGVLAPAGTPPEIVKKLHDDIVEAIQSPDVQQKLLAAGFQIIGNTPEEFTQILTTDLDRFAKLLKSTANTAAH
jgi:tripartite-type tricarboxylate transporter receptor subunit TctC